MLIMLTILVRQINGSIGEFIVAETSIKPMGFFSTENSLMCNKKEFIYQYKEMKQGNKTKAERDNVDCICGPCVTAERRPRFYL